MGRVLIVEDSDQIRADLRKILAESGYESLEAIDGKQGFEYCMQNNDIDVIVTDQNMPEMTGLEMLRALRGTEKYKEIPVVFHTTESKQELRKQGQELGIKGWLVKPIYPEHLVRLLNRLVRGEVRQRDIAS